MTASVFTDPLRGATILVSDDPIYALGPILVADDIEEAMEAMLAFMAGLGEDPSEMPTIRLMIEWQGFLGALTPGAIGVPGGDPVDQEATDGAEATDASTEPPEGLSEPENGSDQFDDDGRADELVELAQPEAGPPVEDAAAGPEPEPEDDEDDEDELDLADRLASIPGGTPRQRGKVECFACGGTGIAPGSDGVQCNLCEGTGKIDEPDPIATTTTQEDEQ